MKKLIVGICVFLLLSTSISFAQGTPNNTAKPIIYRNIENGDTVSYYERNWEESFNGLRYYISLLICPYDQKRNLLQVYKTKPGKKKNTVLSTISYYLYYWGDPGKEVSNPGIVRDEGKLLFVFESKKEMVVIPID